MNIRKLTYVCGTSISLGIAGVAVAQQDSANRNAQRDSQRTTTDDRARQTEAPRLISATNVDNLLKSREGVWEVEVMLSKDYFTRMASRTSTRPGNTGLDRNTTTDYDRNNTAGGTDVNREYIEPNTVDGEGRLKRDPGEITRDDDNTEADRDADARRNNQNRTDNATDNQTDDPKYNISDRLYTKRSGGDPDAANNADQNRGAQNRTGTQNELRNEWDGNNTHTPDAEGMITLRGYAESDLVMNNNILRERIYVPADAQHAGMADGLRGVSYIEFNEADNTYDVVFISNHNQGIHHDTGRFDTQGNRLVFRGERDGAGTYQSDSRWNSADPASRSINPEQDRNPRDADALDREDEYEARFRNQNRDNLDDNARRELEKQAEREAEHLRDSREDRAEALREAQEKQREADEKLREARKDIQDGDRQDLSQQEREVEEARRRLEQRRQEMQNNEYDRAPMNRDGQLDQTRDAYPENRWQTAGSGMDDVVVVLEMIDDNTHRVTMYDVGTSGGAYPLTGTDRWNDADGRARWNGDDADDNADRNNSRDLDRGRTDRNNSDRQDDDLADNDATLHTDRDQPVRTDPSRTDAGRTDATRTNTNTNNANRNADNTGVRADQPVRTAGEFGRVIYQATYTRAQASAESRIRTLLDEEGTRVSSRR